MQELRQFVSRPKGFGVRANCPLKTPASRNFDDFCTVNTITKSTAATETFVAAYYIKAVIEETWDAAEPLILQFNIRGQAGPVPWTMSHHPPALVDLTEEGKEDLAQLVNLQYAHVRASAAAMTKKMWTAQQVTSFFHDVTPGNSTTYAPPRYHELINWASTIYPSFIDDGEVMKLSAQLISGSEFMKQRMTYASSAKIIQTFLESYPAKVLDAWLGGEAARKAGTVAVYAANLVPWDKLAYSQIPPTFKGWAFLHARQVKMEGATADGFFPSGRKCLDTLPPLAQKHMSNYHGLAAAKLMKQQELLLAQIEEDKEVAEPVVLGGDIMAGVTAAVGKLGGSGVTPKVIKLLAKAAGFAIDEDALGDDEPEDDDDDIGAHYAPPHPHDEEKVADADVMPPLLAGAIPGPFAAAPAVGPVAGLLGPGPAGPVPVPEGAAPPRERGAARGGARAPRPSGGRHDRAAEPPADGH